jgi:chromate reductase, NAD(P)H dehydrogenase (quinone)
MTTPAESPLRILTLSGSLRETSSNSRLLRAAATLAPAGLILEPYQGLGELPHFNPDLDGSTVPAPVAELRRLVGRADGLLISSPEYARGVPGTLKNGLDWLVGGPEMAGKPVALLNASPRATHAQASLELTLRTMAAVVVAEGSATVPLLGTGLDESGIVATPEVAEPVRAALTRLGEAILALRRGRG